MKSPALMSLSQGIEYTVKFPADRNEAVTEKLKDLLSADTLPVERRVKIRKKKKFPRYKKTPTTKTVDIRPLIKRVELTGDQMDTLRVSLIPQGNLQGKMKEILPLLLDTPEFAEVTKDDTLVEREGEWVSLSQGWTKGGEQVV